ncbi:MAG: PspA/IM30 family protein, partial [Sphingopyxis sp.]
AALVEKQKAGDMAERLKSEIAVLDDALKGYENDIAKLQKKLSEARARQSSVVNRLESAENRYKLREMTNGDRVEDAFSRFEILERRVDEAEGRADALSLGYKKSLDEEIAELQSADKVADELAALKAAQAKN